jgi:hypothetical protein
VSEAYASSDDDEGPEQVPPISRRSTLSSTTTRYYTSDDGHTVVEVEPSECYGERGEHFDPRDSISSGTLRHATSASVQAASLAMSPSRGSGGSSVSRTLSSATGRKSQVAGFRHNSETHTTYNITNKDSGRQLFVSAPIGSREAAVHDQVVMQAATSGSRVSFVLVFVCTLH